MKITRVILVGNSLKQPEVKEDAVKKPVSPPTLITLVDVLKRKNGN